jgi:hypothetical protein
MRQPEHGQEEMRRRCSSVRGMAKLRLINDVTKNPRFLLLMGVLVVGNAGLLIRDFYSEEPDTLGVVLRIGTVVCWLVLLTAGLIGRYRQRRQTAERGLPSPGDGSQTTSLHHL